MKQQKQRKSWCKFRRKLSPPREILVWGTERGQGMKKAGRGGLERGSSTETSSKFPLNESQSALVLCPSNPHFFCSIFRVFMP